MSMLDTYLSNRVNFSPARDKWMHVCPLGEHPWTSPDGKETVVQVIDAEACAEMARTYPLSGPLSRVDVDHLSMHPENTTEACAWGQRAEVRDNGLWVLAELTSHGAPLVNGKVYQYTSPVFPRDGLVPLGGNRFRVTKLGVIALTNDPNLRGQEPLTNRRAQAANPNTNTPAKMDYKAELLKILGLPPEATDEQIANGCSGQKGKTDAMNSRITELGDLLANRDLDEHGITDIEQRKLLMPSLTNSATRPAALALIANKSQNLEVRPPLHNRGNAGVPMVAALKQPKDAAVEADNAKASWIGNRARALARDGRRHQDCFVQAEAEYAEQFGKR